MDRNPRSRVLVAATIARCLPDAAVFEVGDNIADALGGAALAHAVVGVFVNALTARIFVSLVREANAQAPVLILSDVDCRNEVMEAGATHFLLTDEWLMTGSVLEELLKGKAAG